MTDRERDIQMALSVVGQPNDYFKPIWLEFASGWDGAPCSEIACCISYMAGNLDKIYVANWAEGLFNMFSDAGRVSQEPQPGDFIFFGYGSVPDHTGRVIEIGNGSVTTVEGNINNKVVKRNWWQSDSYIFAFGHPKYDAVQKDHITPDEFIYNAIRDVSLFNRCGDCEYLTRMIQQYLFNLGLYEGTVDGDFGYWTEKAVKKYQQNNDLLVDGIVGRYTWEKLLND